MKTTRKDLEIRLDRVNIELADYYNKLAKEIEAAKTAKDEFKAYPLYSAAITARISTLQDCLRGLNSLIELA